MEALPGIQVHGRVAVFGQAGFDCCAIGSEIGAIDKVSCFLNAAKAR